MRYKTLRKVMRVHDVTQLYLGELIGRSGSYVATRFSGKYDWGSEDMYRILEQFGVSPAYMHLLFPRNGIATDEELEQGKQLLTM